jgi:glycerol-3-phosphate acyltransferase PlsX
MAGSPLIKLGGLLLKPALGSLRTMMDPSQEGAAPLLGVNGLMYIGHGRSNALAVENAVRVADEASRAGVLQSIREEISRRVPTKE